MAGEKKQVDKEYQIAYDFATKVYKNFKELIKTVVLFGSIPKGTVHKKSDIDIIIIIDDCTINWDNELIAWYRTELGRVIAKENYKDILHVNTVTLSTFWDEVRAGEPLAINIIRYGQILLDFGGFFEPLKVLLAKGKIRATPEAVFTTLKRAPDHLMRAEASIYGAIEGFYWAMVDSSHAALMAINAIPPSPEHLSELLEQNFVNTKRLNKKYVKWYEELRTLAKDISYGNVKRVKGETIETQQDRTEEFVKVLRDLTESLIRKEKIIKIEEKKE